MLKNIALQFKPAMLKAFCEICIEERTDITKIINAKIPVLTSSENVSCDSKEMPIRENSVIYAIEHFLYFLKIRERQIMNNPSDDDLNKLHDNILNMLNCREVLLHYGAESNSGFFRFQDISSLLVEEPQFLQEYTKVFKDFLSSRMPDIVTDDNLELLGLSDDYS